VLGEGLLLFDGDVLSDLTCEAFVTLDRVE
jgi:hypothetical protein